MDVMVHVIMRLDGFAMLLHFNYQIVRNNVGMDKKIQVIQEMDILHILKHVMMEIQQIMMVVVLVVQ